MSRNNAGLSSERIITEALRIIDGQGLRRLTMRRLGDALAVEAMAIYHHFPRGKEQLFDAIVEYITDVSPAPHEPSTEEATQEPGDHRTEGGGPEDGGSWDERLRSWARDYRSALLRHAGALSLFINRRPDTPAALRSLETHYAAFAEAGLSDTRIRTAAATLDAYVVGAVIHQVRAEGAPSPNPAVLDGRYPHVAAVGDTAPDFDAQFLAGLEALLAGLVRPDADHLTGKVPTHGDTADSDS